MKKLSLLFVLFVHSFLLLGQETSQPIHTEVFGNGEPILFIPGFTVPGDIWSPLVKELESTYECHVFTLAGFDGKAPIPFPWLPKVNSAIKNYIAENDLENVTIIGHSLGGTIATWLASREDSKINKIILVDALPAAGALMIPDYDPDKLVYDSPYNNQQLAMDDLQFEQMATAMSQGMSLNTSAQEDIKNWMLKADRKTYVYGYTDYLKLDLREDLKKITIPVTIIAATKPYGKDMVIQTYNDQYAHLERYDLILAQDSAHFVMLDQPEWFIEQMKSIFTKN